MARRKGVPREDQHDWKPGAADMVQCEKCGHLTSADQARRGIGPCPGKPDTVDAVPDDPGTLVPEGARAVYADREGKEQLIGYLEGKPSVITYFPGQEPPVIAGGEPRKVESLCDICVRSRPSCGNDPSTVQRVVNDDILECTDYTTNLAGDLSDATFTDNEIEAKPADPPEPVVHPGPHYIEPEETCNACHGRLAIIPLSPRLSFVGCPTRGCDLWRERLRWYPRQDRNPRTRRVSRANND